MSNTLTYVIPQLLAQALETLRENSIVPLLVNRKYEVEAGKKGSTIEVPIPAGVNVKDVAPSSTPATSGDMAPTSVNIELNRWKEAPFTMTDKEMMEVMNGFLPMQAAEAVKALANYVDQDILSLYKGVYGVAGVAGTTPFAVSTKEATQARKVLSNQLCPLGDRRFVFNADAEANALNLRAFQDMNFAVPAMDIIQGKLTPKLGFQWFMDQNVREHTVGSLGGAPETPTLVNGVNAAGAETLGVTVGAGAAMALKEGDIITVAGDSQTYVVTADTACTAGSNKSVPISPPLKVATTGSEAITLEGAGLTSYPVNLAFHRDAIAFASRPLAAQSVANSNIFSTVDPLSGLTLRVEVTRQNKQDRWSFDILYGRELVRAPLACRVHG